MGPVTWDDVTETFEDMETSSSEPVSLKFCSEVAPLSLTGDEAHRGTLKTKVKSIEGGGESTNQRGTLFFLKLKFALHALTGEELRWMTVERWRSAWW